MKTQFLPNSFMSTESGRPDRYAYPAAYHLPYKEQHEFFTQIKLRMRSSDREEIFFFSSLMYDTRRHFNICDMSAIC